MRYLRPFVLVYRSCGMLNSRKVKNIVLKICLFLMKITEPHGGLQVAPLFISGGLVASGRYFTNFLNMASAKTTCHARPAFVFGKFLNRRL
jgi:hypothetical protein